MRASAYAIAKKLKPELKPRPSQLIAITQAMTDQADANLRHSG
jgi:hypothetical protein